jgi:hypothetical protein
MAIVEEHEMHETRTGPNGKSTATVSRPEEPKTYREGEAERGTMLKAGAGGSMGTALLGLGAIVLAILGLANFLPALLLHISVIALGVAFLIESSAIAARFMGVVTGGTRGGIMNAVGLGGGLGLGFLAGAAGIVLGILALLRFYPAVLIPAAIITLGASLVLGSGLAARLESIAIEQMDTRDPVRDLSYEAIAASVGLKALMGLGAIVLGILALLGIHTLTLSLVAVLGLGFAMFSIGGMAGLGSMGLVKQHDTQNY